MRKIKYRIWDKIFKNWLDYDEFYIDQEGEVYLIEERSWAYQSYMHKENASENVVICQFTGLKGKNGKEIYEGDIVKIFPNEGYRYLTMDSDIGIIEYVHSSYMIRPTTDSNPYFLIYAKVEVIGNIYENPELLEGAQ